MKAKKDLTITHPHLCEEWDYEANGDLRPEHLTYGSKKLVCWQCSKKHNHKWSATPNTRTSQNQNCPYCSGQRVCEENCLATVDPEVAKEWDYKGNGELTPKDVTANSSKIVWWICKNNPDHRRRVSVNERRRYGCPYCSSNLVSKENSLAFLFENISSEWDYVKNKGITPDKVTGKSTRKAWWICSKCGGSWRQTIKNRSLNNSGCPKCNKELKTSFPEQAIFFYLKKIFAEVFNQYYIDHMEVDIFIPSLNLVIEYDGVYYHKNKEEKDEDKNERLSKRGVFLIRVREQGLSSLEYCQNIFCDKSSYSLDETIKDILQYIYNTFPIDKIVKEKIKSLQIDIAKDRIYIYENYIKISKERSMGNLYPAIAKQWNYSKNGSLRPDMVRPYSSKKVYWSCESRHEWEARISDRTKKNSGCPRCRRLK